MLLKYRDVSRLKCPWYLLELLSEGTVEVTLKRLCLAIPGIFQRSPVLIFAPLDYSRGISLRSGAYLYLQSENFSALARLKRVRGVVGLVTHGNSNNPRDAIQIEPKAVDVMIEAAELDYQERVQSITAGRSVRVLDGLLKNYVGLVQSTHKDRALVLIQTETRLLKLETARGNLVLHDPAGDPFRNIGGPKNPPRPK
jgi:hypothetical protein